MKKTQLKMFAFVKRGTLLNKELIFLLTETKKNFDLSINTFSLFFFLLRSEHSHSHVFFISNIFFLQKYRIILISLTVARTS